jgi:hypothetical protein
MPDEHIRPIIKGLPVWNKQINELIMHTKYYQDKEDFHTQGIQSKSRKKKNPVPTRKNQKES